jgi:hypothetical protein
MLFRFISLPLASVIDHLDLVMHQTTFSYRHFGFSSASHLILAVNPFWEQNASHLLPQLTL